MTDNQFYIDKLHDRIEQTEEGLQKIVQWADAYPLDIFPEPDWKRARDALALVGMTLDSISAACMRHVVDGAGDIARRALAKKESSPPAFHAPHNSGERLPSGDAAAAGGETLVKRLRDAAVVKSFGVLPSRKLYTEAADRIEELEQ